MRYLSLLLSGALFTSAAHAAPPAKNKAPARTFTAATTSQPDQAGKVTEPTSPAPSRPVTTPPLRKGNDAVQAAVAGKVSDVRGAPQIIRNGQTFKADVNQDLREGDRITTDDGSRLKARMIDDTLLSVGAKSSLTIDRYAYAPDTNVRTAKLRAAFGVFRVWVTKAVKKNSTFEVMTPTAVAGVRGTHFMGIVTEASSAIASVEGRVAVRSANEEIEGEVTLLDGQGTDVGANATPTVPVTWGNPRFYQLYQETE